MEELNLEQKRALALARAKQKQAESQGFGNIQPIQDPQIREQLGTSMYGPTEVVYEGVADPIIMGSAMMGDVAVNTIIGIADFLGNDRFVAEMNARKDTGNMPTDIANQIVEIYQGLPFEFRI